MLFPCPSTALDAVRSTPVCHRTWRLRRTQGCSIWCHGAVRGWQTETGVYHGWKTCEMERDVVEPGARGRRGSLCRCGVVTGRNRIGGFRSNAVARMSVSPTRVQWSLIVVQIFGKHSAGWYVARRLVRGAQAGTWRAGWYVARRQLPVALYGSRFCISVGKLFGNLIRVHYVTTLVRR